MVALFRQPGLPGAEVRGGQAQRAHLPQRAGLLRRPHRFRHRLRAHQRRRQARRRRGGDYAERGRALPRAQRDVGRQHRLCRRPAHAGACAHAGRRVQHEPPHREPLRQPAADRHRGPLHEPGLYALQRRAHRARRARRLGRPRLRRVRGRRVLVRADQDCRQREDEGARDPPRALQRARADVLARGHHRVYPPARAAQLLQPGSPAAQHRAGGERREEER